MKNLLFTNNSEKTRNYMKSVIECGDPISKDEFVSTYVKLSSAKKKTRGAKRNWYNLVKEGLIKEA